MKMITKTKQSWSVGATVKAGFVTVVVKAVCATPGAPDAYVCTNTAGTQLYSFVPHNGLTKITAEEAREMIAVSERHAAKLAAQAIAKASAKHKIDAIFA